MAFKLEPQEANTALWKKLKAHAEERLDKLRRQNDGNLSPEETAKLRGRIAECKSFLALEDPRPSSKSSAGDEPPLDQW